MPRETVLKHPTALPSLTQTRSGWLVEANGYRLEIPGDEHLGARPYARFSDAGSVSWSMVSLVASVADVTRGDDTIEFLPLSITETAGLVTIQVPQRSATWDSKIVTLRCSAHALEVSVSVRGSGRIGDLTMLGGTAILASGASGVFRSSIEFGSLFVPVPTGPVSFVRSSAAGAVLGVTGDADAGRLHGIFSPPPLVYGLGRSAPTSPTSLTGSDWLGISVVDAVDRLTFTTFAYDPLDGGFLMRFAYEGHSTVNGTWSSPQLIIRPADDALEIIDQHRKQLEASGFSSTPTLVPADSWWREPIFCGWGAQCALSAQHTQSTGIIAAATGLARQEIYDGFLTTLERAGLSPGTIVLDDRWQAEYGTVEPDVDHWPDLRGWIADRHAEGRRVLLWWKAWDPQGLPDSECITDATGRPVAADPSSPEYRSRVLRILQDLLGPDGLDADGLKVDFTQRTPSGQSLRANGEGWGVALLHQLLQTIYSAAKAAKPESLIITHAIHPSFGDVSDVVRLNDVLEKDAAGARVSVVEQLKNRAAIASRALPLHPLDTDQWPMPSRAEWLAYAKVQATLGIPALYYVDYIDESREPITLADLRTIAGTWDAYRRELARG